MYRQTRESDRQIEGRLERLEVIPRLRNWGGGWEEEKWKVQKTDLTGIVGYQLGRIGMGPAFKHT